MNSANNVTLSHEGEELIATFADGKRVEYKTPIRTLYINVRTLTLSHSYEWDTDKKIKGADTQVLSGLGEVQDYGISVIGKPGSKNKSIAVSIRGAQFERDEALNEPIINASLSYTEHDWEIGNPSEWWVELYVPTDVFLSLLASVEKRKLTSLKIGLESASMYVQTADYFAPPSSSVSWFIKDGHYGADLVHCSTRVFYSKEKELNLQPESATEDTDLSEHEVIVAPCIAETNGSQGMKKLLAQIESLSKDIKIVFWGLVAIAIAILVQK